MHLTGLKLRALPFEDGQRDYPDDATIGLSVRVDKRTKTFTLMPRNPRRRVTLGRYPDLTLSRARERARDLLAEAAACQRPAHLAHLRGGAGAIQEAARPYDAGRSSGKEAFPICLVG
jgi:hypothetical protein